MGFSEILCDFPYVPCLLPKTVHLLCVPSPRQFLVVAVHYSGNIEDIANTIFGSETIIFFMLHMQLRLPSSSWGFHAVGMCSFLSLENYLFYAVAVLEFWSFNLCEKYRDTPPISIAILLQKYALPLAESSLYTTNLYHDTSHRYRDTFADVLGSGVVGTAPIRTKFA